MSTCSLARKPRRGRSGLGFWLCILLHQTPRKAWKQVVPCIRLGSPESVASQHPPVRAAVPKKNTSPAGIPGVSATSHRPGLWNAPTPGGPHRNSQSCGVERGGARSLKVASYGPPPAWPGSGIR